MKVVFAYAGSEIVGIEALSAYLKANGHETALVFDPAHFRGSRGRDNAFLAKYFDPSREEIIQAVLRENPDVLAMSCFTGNFQWALEIAAEVKRRSPKKIPAVFGGVHCSMVPERVIAKDVVDALVIGEGEEALVELVRSVRDGEFTDTTVANAWVKKDGVVHKNPVRPYIKNLDSLPFPDKEMFFAKVPLFRRGYLLMTARGCPYHCSYCSNSHYHDIYCGEKKHVRRFSPGRVIEELKRGMDRGRIDFLNIYDDIFTLDMKWLEEFAPMYRRDIGLPFLCNIHPDHCGEELVKLVKEAGCHTARLGVQTLHEPTLRKTLHRGGTKEKVGQAIDTLNKYGVRVKVEHILGFPGEDEEIQREAAYFYNEHRPTKIQTFWLIPFPGTPIHQTVIEEGIMTEDEGRRFEEGDTNLTYTLFLPNRTSGHQMEDLKSFPLLFGLMPFLPKNTVKNIVDKRSYRKLPFSWMLYQLIILVNAVVNFDREDLHSLFYVFARKKTP